MITRRTPSISSIIRMIWAWSEASIGATEISRTARNLPKKIYFQIFHFPWFSFDWLDLPQLLRCSFSNLKKFHTNLRKTSRGDKIEVSKSPWTYRVSVKESETAHPNLYKKNLVTQKVVTFLSHRQDYLNTKSSKIAK